MSTPLWHTTSSSAPAPDDWAHRFTVGDDYKWDRRLLPYDIRASRAHAWGLRQIEVLSEAEWNDLQEALDALLAAYEAGECTVTPDDEDSHTVIERFVTAKAGPAGRKLHTGRSRNDQVLAALRLYLRDALATLGRRTARLAEALCALADRHPRRPLPGYTHLQRAMPSSVALWALGYAETLADDLATLRHARRRINVSPLGSAAGYGVPVLDLPRAAVADRLGFRTVQTHATAVQLSRGKHELAVAHACTQVGAACNRLASDLVLFASAEFDFVTLPDESCTGSSIMPQKRNPDVLELARAYHHRLAAEMQHLSTGPANLPGGYHRDLQLTKGAVMRSVQITEDVLTALTKVVRGTEFSPDATWRACSPALLATQQALTRVADGIPFRTAYQQAASSPPPDISSPDALFEAYATDGTPGHERPDLIRAQLRTHRAWMATDTAAPADA